jgi:nitrite reductase/ring-hydroxylating ferredoxin subunit
MSSDDGVSTQQAEENLHYVAEIEEFDETDRVIVDVEGREVAVFDLDGEFYALANYCIHQGGPLCEGSVTGALTAAEDFELEYSREDEIIACPWHGWEFDIRTGKHLAQTGHKTPMYEIVVRDDTVYIEF